MYHFVRSIIDSIFPPREEALSVERLTIDDLSGLYQPRHIAPADVLSSFADPRMKALIHEGKFHRNPRAYACLAQIVTVHLTSDTEKDFKDFTYIPLPLSRERERSRGYNQVYEILRAVQKTLPQVHIETNALVRVRDTAPQTSLGRDARLKNMDGAFSVIAPERIRGNDVILLDDVLTTGATLTAARDALLIAHPRSITCIAIAH